MSTTTKESGAFEFTHGALVKLEKAVQEGACVVLNELNIAQNDVLDALNSLLDQMCNKQLYIAETKESISPGSSFQLFTTQKTTIAAKSKNTSAYARFQSSVLWTARWRNHTTRNRADHRRLRKSQKKTSRYSIINSKQKKNANSCITWFIKKCNKSQVIKGISHLLMLISTSTLSVRQEWAGLLISSFGASNTGNQLFLWEKQVHERQQMLK